ncbi:MAG: peptide chain release factor N(5)-glutamine methyltransferase, partial [Rhodobacterales bacterium]|nr:peptide chain release factor N(5)-glutamine methyltransferase [Rhodobacterales bacterium]
MATVALILKESSQLLETISGQNSNREAKILLEFTLGLQGKSLQLDLEISDDIYNYFKTLINKRLEFQPISQIIGERYFWKNKFIVSPNVLDPR